jgi:actin-related protein 2
MKPSTITTNNILVFDIGAGSIKLGVAGSLDPGVKVPCLVGIPTNHHRQRMGVEPAEAITKEHMLVGDNAISKVDTHRIHYSFHTPINASTGVVEDWPALKILLCHALEKKLGRSCDTDTLDCYSKYKVLVAKSYGMSRTDLALLVSFFMEELGVQAINLHDSAALVLYTQGLETGIVVEAGEGMVHILPVYKGHAIPKNNKRLPIGGRTLTMHLMRLLQRKGYRFLTGRENYLEVIRSVKERYCYVALDWKQEERLAEETTILDVEVHDLSHEFGAPSITLGRERFEAVEALLDPSLLDMESKGLADLIFECIQETSIGCRVGLYQNIVLSGGTTLLPGLANRLKQDLDCRYMQDVLNGGGQRFNIGIRAPSDRGHLVFEGASLLAEWVANQDKHWVSQQDYETYGMEAVFLAHLQNVG